jgi:hypothetical protein
MKYSAIIIQISSYREKNCGAGKPKLKTPWKNKYLKMEYEFDLP